MAQQKTGVEAGLTNEGYVVYDRSEIVEDTGGRNVTPDRQTITQDQVKSGEFAEKLTADQEDTKREELAEQARDKIANGDQENEKKLWFGNTEAGSDPESSIVPRSDYETAGTTSTTGKSEDKKNNSWIWWLLGAGALGFILTKSKKKSKKRKR